MQAQDADSLNRMQALLLLAASAHGLRPGIELRANCAKVVWQALRWAGLADATVSAAWEEFQDHPVIGWCYDTLIAMIRHQPAEEALFEGAGNFGDAEGPAAYPHFTACRLTPCGNRIAEQLLERHPEYRKPG